MLKRSCQASSILCTLHTSAQCGGLSTAPIKQMGISTLNARLGRRLAVQKHRAQTTYQMWQSRPRQINQANKKENTHKKRSSLILLHHFLQQWQIISVTMWDAKWRMINETFILLFNHKIIVESSLEILNQCLFVPVSLITYDYVITEILSSVFFTESLNIFINDFQNKNLHY